MFADASAIVGYVFDHSSLTTVVVGGLTLLGFMHFTEFLYGQYVDWRLKMQAHSRRLPTGEQDARKADERSDKDKAA